MYLISGVSGVGKTAVMRELKSLLVAPYEIHDFDERGVPAGADHAWRLKETRYWIELGEKKEQEGIVLIVCGFVNPEEIASMAGDSSKVQTILLDAEPTIIEERLRNRNQDTKVKADLERVVGDSEAFIQNNTNFIPVLREICERYHCPVIDTSHLAPKQGAEKVAAFIK